MTFTCGSIDIETYGAVEQWFDGSPLPLQGHPTKPFGRFHPMRSLLQDKVPLNKLIVSVSVTLVEGDPSQGALSYFADCKPKETMVFWMNDQKHRKILAEWLQELPWLLGMNLLFDVPYLRMLPQFKPLLENQQTLIDLSVVNYLESEVRSARSLKTLGPVLRTHSYDETLRSFRFKTPLHVDAKGRSLKKYNGQDSHNTVLATQELCRRMLHTHGPNTAKLSDFSLNFYSDLIWSCTRMVEAGIPVSTVKLGKLEEKCKTTLDATANEALTKHNIIINGEGSKKSKDDFIKGVVAEVQKFNPHLDVLSHPLVKLTDKKKEVSWSDQNRIFFRLLLPKDHPLQPVLKLLDDNSRSQKLLGSYIQPILHHKSNDEENESSRALGIGDVKIAYPTIYLVPSQAKDTSEDSGGQQQGRISFKNFAAQTSPKQIKDCYASRFGINGVIRSYDLAQAELRVAGVLSGEPTLIRDFIEGIDLHATRAVSSLELDITSLPEGWNYDGSPGNKLFKKHFDTPRQAAKHANFTDLNWGSALTLQKTILKKGGQLVPFELCKALVDSRERVRPILYKWQCDWVHKAQKDHVLTLPFTGQSRTFTGLVQGNDVNEAINFPIQALAANTMLRIQHYVHRKLPAMSRPGSPCFMFLNCYDALFFDCHKTFLRSLDEIMAEAVAIVSTKDYWHMVCTHYGNFVPLVYEGTTK